MYSHTNPAQRVRDLRYADESRFFYCTVGSDVAFALSEIVAGALHALASVRNFSHALVRALCHALRAVLMDVVKVVHAALTAVLIALLPPVCMYACWSALARALYAAFAPCVNAIIALSNVCSRILTAAPTQAIAAAEPGFGDGLGIAVAANAGKANAVIMPTEAEMAKMFFFINSDCIFIFKRSTFAYGYVSLYQLLVLIATLARVWIFLKKVIHS